MNLEDLRACAERALVDRSVYARVHEPITAYYRFLALLSEGLELELNDLRCLEIGTYQGSSAAHLAASGATVVTIDVNPDAARLARALAVAQNLRITPITANSGFVLGDPVEAAKIRALAPYDILYIDGDHTFNSAYGDYTHFWPLVREGGVIVFDDIELDMAGDEMRVFWDRVVDPKVKLNALHETGFGAAIRGRVPPPPWEAVITDVTREILGRARPAPTG